MHRNRFHPGDTFWTISTPRTAGRMTPQGQRQIDAARAYARWDAAYAPIRSASAATLPADLRAAIDASDRARAASRKKTPP